MDQPAAKVLATAHAASVGLNGSIVPMARVEAAERLPEAVPAQTVVEAVMAVVAETNPAKSDPAPEPPELQAPSVSIPVALPVVVVAAAEAAAPVALGPTDPAVAVAPMERTALGEPSEP